ncbi:MAG: bifunctional oligoribonuclease/PAP phosphatase NrnA [bacterium]|nr:bifunctional oligoribonuclease/PAP phosphatase NrnA [bacterium]
MSDESDQEHSLQAAAGAIAAADSIVAVGHIRPDGDALGASLALALAARGAGKRAYVTFGEPFDMPHQFRYLDLSPLVPVDDVPTPVDLFVACDTAAKSRLGSAAQLTEHAKSVLVVDHHLSNGGFGDVRYIDSSASATAEMAYRLIRELGWEITPQIGDALYTGLVTDTGRFQYSVTSPAVHRITAELIEAGVKPERIGRHIYEESPFGYLLVAGRVLARAHLEVEKSLVWSTLCMDDLGESGIGLEDADGLIDLIRVAQEAHVACLLRVHEGTVKGSLRSRGEVDVAAIAATFGGGGHHNASGFTFEGEPEAAIKKILGQL